MKLWLKKDTCSKTLPILSAFWSVAWFNVNRSTPSIACPRKWSVYWDNPIWAKNWQTSFTSHCSGSFVAGSWGAEAEVASEPVGFSLADTVSNWMRLVSWGLPVSNVKCYASYEIIVGMVCPKKENPLIRFMKSLDINCIK